MSSFFGTSDSSATTSDASGAGAGAGAPVFTGATTREQFTPPTGAASDNSASSGTAASGTANDAGSGGGGVAGAATAPGSAAPAAGAGGAASGGGAQAPAYTNLAQFIGAQDPNEIQSQTNSITGSAASNASAATAAGNAASGGTQSAAAAGTNTGSVGYTPAGSTGGPWNSDSAATGGLSAMDAAISGHNAASASNGQATTSGGVATSDGGSVETASLSSDPTVDLSKTSLSSYSGPTSGDVSNSFASATGAANTASTQAAAMQTGAVTPNAFDNALETQTPAWGQIQAAIGADNTAAQNVAAQQQGGQQAVTNAQNSSGANITTQRNTLSLASAGEAATASTNSAITASVASEITSGDFNAAAQDPSVLASLGLTPAEMTQLAGLVQSGQMSPQQAQNAVKQYETAASGATGYTQAGAATTNSINSLLGSGTASVNSGLGSVPTTSSLDTSIAAQNQNAVTNLKTLASGPATLANVTQRDNIAADLIAQGYTVDQIASLTGISLSTLQQWGETTSSNPTDIANGLTNAAKSGNKVTGISNPTAADPYGNANYAPTKSTPGEI